MLKPFRPMEPILTEELLEGEEYLYQIKWDGIRILSLVEKGVVRLFTRHEKQREQTYPEIRDAISNKFVKQTLILDGEIISIKNGKPDFFQIVKRDRMRTEQKIISATTKIPVTYIIFDLLYWDGEWLFEKPLIERLQRLDNILEPTDQIQITPSFSQGKELWDWTRERGWEGIVIKEKKGQYFPGQKHPTWRKMKHFQEIDANILGVTLKGGNVYSLLLAIGLDDHRYRYIGRVSSGLSSEERQILTIYSKELAIDTPVPVVAMPKFREEEIRWFPPTMKARIRFLEWSPDGILRNPVILNFYT